VRVPLPPSPHRRYHAHTPPYSSLGVLSVASCSAHALQSDLCREKQARKKLEDQHAAELKSVHAQLSAAKMASAGHQFKETALRAKIGRRDEKIQALQKVMQERDERWRQRLLPYLEAAGADAGGA
jgi:hypothetical protein